MDDFSEKIGSILSDPSMMEQIKSLGSMLGVSEPQQQQKPPEPSPPPQSGGLLGASSFSPEMIGMFMKFAPLLSSMNEENDSTRLLYALKPFLSEKRRSRIDGSVRLLNLMRILPMLKEVL
ncbi:MAG: hypothetical protein IJ192_14665 [Clostridia bacterium]|nr:hypothetical protein [Clostridia bacterium]